MKKIFPLILSLALLLSISANVLATEVSQEKSVTASYSAVTEAPVISVDIEWEGMNFTYKGASDPVWDASTHKYVEQEGAWVEGEATITITNHSSMILQAKLGYQQETDFDNIFMKFTDKAPYIGSAYTSTDGEGEACQVQVLAVPVGDLPAQTTDETKIGTIQVKVQTGDDYGTVVGAIEGLYAAIPDPDDQTVTRGTAYYGSASDKSTVEAAYIRAMDLIGNEEAKEAEKNSVLNQLITAYYNALRIGQ